MLKRLAGVGIVVGVCFVSVPASSAAVLPSATQSTSASCFQVATWKRYNSVGSRLGDGASVKNICSSSKKIKINWNNALDGPCWTLAPNETRKDYAGYGGRYDGLKSC